MPYLVGSLIFIFGLVVGGFYVRWRMSMIAIQQPIEKQSEQMQTFEADHPLVLRALSDGMQQIRDNAGRANITSEDQLPVRALTDSIAENLFDIIILAEHGRCDSALRLMRSPYEKLLYAHHIANTPEMPRRFVLFETLKDLSIREKLEKHFNIPISDEMRKILHERHAEAKRELGVEKCKTCGTERERWTKVNPEQMADAVGTHRKYHFLAYDFSTQLIHPSNNGMKAQDKNWINVGLLMLVCRDILTKTLRVQIKHLKIPQDDGQLLKVSLALRDCFGTADEQGAESTGD